MAKGKASGGGFGKVLLGLIRTADKSVGMFNAEDEKSLENAFSGLHNQQFA